MCSRHRFDSGSFFLDAILAMNPKVNLSINWHSIFEIRWTVNIPIVEDRPCVTRDRHKTRWTMKALQPGTVAPSVLFVIFREVDNRFPGNVEFLFRLHVPQVGSNQQKANPDFLHPKR